MFPRIQFYREVAPILHAGQLSFITVDGRRQCAAHKLLIAINVNRGLGRLGVVCFWRIRSRLLGDRSQAREAEDQQP